MGGSTQTEKEPVLVPLVREARSARRQSLEHSAGQVCLASSKSDSDVESNISEQIVSLLLI